MSIVTCGQDLLKGKYMNTLCWDCFAKFCVFRLKNRRDAVEKVCPRFVTAAPVYPVEIFVKASSSSGNKLIVMMLYRK